MADKDGGKNWKGANGFSIERWNFWKKRLGEIKGLAQASEKTKELGKFVVYILLVVMIDRLI
jgi:hypothetical protein